MTYEDDEEVDGEGDDEDYDEDDEDSDDGDENDRYDEDDEDSDDDDEDDGYDEDNDDDDEDDRYDEDNDDDDEDDRYDEDDEDLEEIRKSLQRELEELSLSQRRTMQYSKESRESWLYKVAKALAAAISAPFRWIVDVIRGIFDGLFK